MPLVRIDLWRGKSPAYKKAICDAIYTATFAVPENDRFMIVTEHDPDNFVHAESDTRTVEQKQAFFGCTLLKENPGLRMEDVFINVVECKKENWSFGNGVAQYAATTS